MQITGNIIKASICFVVMAAILAASYLMFFQKDAPAHTGASVSQSLNTTLEKVMPTTTNAAHDVPQK